MMLGVVLCGGQSTRMGSDKALLQLNGIHWAQIAAGKLAALQLPVVLSVNVAQHATYQSVFAATELIQDQVQPPVGGPLAGILSVHLCHPQQDLLVLACDMPAMETGLLQSLKDIQHTQTAGVYLYSINNEPEPLCGLYTSKGLAAILQLHYSGQLHRHSMKYALQQLSVYQLPVQAQQQTAFTNINTKADLNNLQSCGRTINTYKR